MEPSEEPMIRLVGVGKTYPDGTVAVHELDLDVPRGSLVCLVGPPPTAGGAGRGEPDR